MKVLMTILILFSRSLYAQWQPCGVAVCDTPGSGTISKLPEIAPDGRGGAYVVWRDARNGVDYDIYAQRVDSNGVMQWQHNGLPLAVLPYGQDFPMVSSDASGGMFAAWEDSRSATRTFPYAQHIDSAGTALWPSNGVQVSVVGGLFVRPTSDGRGGMIVGWGNTYDPYVQRLNSLGQRMWGDSGIQLSTRPETIWPRVAVTGDGSGGAIVAWIEGNSTYAQRVDSTGQICWQANGVSLSGTAQYSRWTIGAVSDMQGGALVTWTRIPNSGVYLQRINGNGQVLWADTGLYVSFGGTAENIVSDGAGGAIVLTAYVAGTTVVDRLYRVRANGSHYWPGGVPFTQEAISEISLSSDGTQGAFVAMTKSGGRINVQWIDSSGAVRYDSNGVVICNHAAGPEHPRVAAVEIRQAIAVWNVGGPGSGSYTSVYAAKVSNTGVVLGVEPTTRVIPSAVRLFQNFPNPFNPETTIEFSLPHRGWATLKVVDVLGREVALLVDEKKEAGTYSVQWNVSSKSTGVYFYTLQVDGVVLTKKMVSVH